MIVTVGVIFGQKRVATLFREMNAKQLRAVSGPIIERMQAGDDCWIYFPGVARALAEKHDLSGLVQ